MPKQTLKGPFHLPTFILLVLCALSPQLHAKKTVEVVLLESHPWSYIVEGKLEGIYPSLFRTLNQQFKEHVEFNLRVMPLKRIIHSFETQSDVDLTIMSYRAEREKVMQPLLPIYRSPFILMTTPSSKIFSLSDLSNKKIAMLRGGSGCPCPQLALKYQPVKLNNHHQGMLMLSTGRVDAVAGPSIRLISIKQKLNLNKIQPSIVYDWRTTWIWGRLEGVPDSESWLPSLEKALNGSTFDKLLKDYLTSEQVKFIFPASH